jgi:hypothetical protein
MKNLTKKEIGWILGTLAYGEKEKDLMITPYGKKLMKKLGRILLSEAK